MLDPAPDGGIEYCTRKLSAAGVAKRIWPLWSIMGGSEAGSSVIGYISNWLTISRTRFFYPWVCWPQPVGYAIRQASFLVSRWLCHFNALHPHSNLGRQGKDGYLFRFRKPLPKALLGTSHVSLTRTESHAHSLMNHWQGNETTGIGCEDSPPASGLGPE